MLKSYIPGNNSLIYPNRYYNNLFSGKIVNKFYDWMEKNSHVIQSQNVSESLFVKINCDVVNEQKHLLQISVQELHNYLTLPIYQGCFFGARNEDGEVFI